MDLFYFMKTSGVESKRVSNIFAKASCLHQFGDSFQEVELKVLVQVVLVSYRQCSLVCENKILIIVGHNITDTFWPG